MGCFNRSGNAHGTELAPFSVFLRRLLIFAIVIGCFVTESAAVPEFTNPIILILLPLAPLLFAWWLRRRRASLRFADTRVFAGLPVGRARRARFFSAGLRALALVSLIVAAAGPRLPDLKTRIPTESIAIMIVLDCSGSMEAETFTWQPGSSTISRKEAARRAFRLFVGGGDAPDGTHFDGRSTERGTDAIGLVTFANWPQPVCPPTLNHSVLLHLLDDSRPLSVRDEGSNIGDAIAEGLIRLEKATPTRKVLILLSDGELNYPDQIDPERKPLKPRQSAQLAANLKIPIYVIDTGGELPPGAAPDEVKQRDDGREINQAVANLTGGKLFSANDGQQLLEVCKAIDHLERQPILSNTYWRYHQLYPWFAAAAAGLLALVFFMEQTRWRRIP
jgi:Ca-activated chloride channel homolog